MSFPPEFRRPTQSLPGLGGAKVLDRDLINALWITHRSVFIFSSKYKRNFAAVRKNVDEIWTLARLWDWENRWLLGIRGWMKVRVLLSLPSERHFRYSMTVGCNLINAAIGWLMLSCSDFDELRSFPVLATLHFCVVALMSGSRQVYGDCPAIRRYGVCFCL